MVQNKRKTVSRSGSKKLSKSKSLSKAKILSKSKTLVFTKVKSKVDIKNIAKTLGIIHATSVGLGLIWYGCGYLGDKHKKDKIYKIYLAEKDKFNKLNHKVRLLDFEIQGIKDEKIHKQKKLVIDDMKEELHDIEFRLDRLGYILNIKRQIPQEESPLDEIKKELQKLNSVVYRIDNHIHGIN